MSSSSSVSRSMKQFCLLRTVDCSYFLLGTCDVIRWMKQKCQISHGSTNQTTLFASVMDMYRKFSALVQCPGNFPTCLLRLWSDLCCRDKSSGTFVGNFPTHSMQSSKIAYNNICAICGKISGTFTGNMLPTH